MKTVLLNRTLTCAALLLLTLPAFAAPPTPLTLRELLARHQKAAGTPAARQDQSPQEVVYDVSAGGLTGTMTTYEAPPHRTRTEIALGPLTMVSGSDGKTTWEQDGAGNVRILGGEELSEDKADTSFSLESFDPFKKGTHAVVTLRPARDPETGCYVVDVQPRGGSAQTIYLDPKTYLVSKSVVRKGGLAAVISILAYRTEFGQALPSRLQIQYGGLPLAIDATLQKAVRLPTVEAKLFQPPTVPRDWEFLTPGAGTEASLPFSADGDEVVVDVSVNGHPLRLLLDSGAGSSFVTAQAAQAAGLTMTGDLPALGYGGTSATGVATAATVEIGSAVRLRGLPLHVVKDPNLAKLLSDRGQVDGAIGYDVFTRFVVRIDYPGKRLTLSDPAAPPAPAAPGTLTLPLKLENRTPTVLASVDGHAPARFLVDTGDAGEVHLYSQYAQANGLLPKPGDPHARTSVGMGVGGTLTETLTPAHTLSLGGQRLSGVTIATMSGPGITQISTTAGGIGNLALHQFIATFDYAHNRLRLEPVAPPAPNSGGAGGEAKPAVYYPRHHPRLLLADDVVTPHMTLQTLLARHLYALGGAEAVAAIKNTRTTSDVSTGGIHGTITTVYAEPDKEYEEDKLGILDIVQGYDGKTAWQRDTNGNVRPLAGEELKDLRVQLFFDTNSYVLPGRMPGKLTLRPDREMGTGNYVVDALPDGGKPTTLFFDPRTFFIVKEQHLDDNVQVTTTYGDYRTVDGTRFPFRTATTNGTARYDITGTVTKLENNVALPPGLFQPPTGGDKFRFLHAGDTQATVPFDMDDGEIGVGVRINGQPARVFLDSGASGIALSQQTATQLGLKTSGFLEARGYGGSTDLRPIRIDRFEVPGAIQLTDVAAIAIDLPDTLNSYFSRPLAGFVGYDLLAHFVVRVDFPKKQLTFISPAAFKPTAADGPALPIELDNDVPSVQAQIDALPPARFLIDTGDEAVLRLYSPYVSDNGLDKKYPHGALTTGGGIGGVSRSRTTRIGSFHVAGVTFRSVPTDFSLDPKGGASQVNAGSLGSALLSRFVVTFDYPHGRIFLAPAPEAREAFVTRTSGLTLRETKDAQGRSHLVIAEIQSRSPASGAGLNAYDELLEVDGQPADRLGLEGARRLLSVASGHPTHTLLVQSTIGGARSVKISLYDPLQ